MIKIFYNLICVNHNNLCSIRNSILVLFFLISTDSFSQTISRIEITGRKTFSANEYLSLINIPPNSPSFIGLEDTVKSRIAAGLQSRGYYHTVFNSVHLQNLDSVRSALMIDLTEGEPTLINEITFGSPVRDSLNITNILSQIKGAPLTSANIDFAFSEVLDYYENSGFPFSSIQIESVEFKDDSTSEDYSANLIISIEEGTKSTIDRIEIEGNDKTRDFVILRTIQIKPGEKYSQKEIDEIPYRLNRLLFFESVDQPAFYFNSRHEGILKIKVKEKQTNFFDGIIGYVPAANEKQKGYLTGFVNVNLRNLFGTGRAAFLRWQHENSLSQELELRYLEPWLFGYPFNIEARLFQRKQDSTYIQRNLEGRLEYIATNEISASLLLSTESTIPSELLSGTPAVSNSSSLTSGINFRIDTRDDFYAPTKGIFFNNTYKYTSKKINSKSVSVTSETRTGFSLQRLEFDLNIYQRFFEKQVAAFSIHARELRGDDIELSDLYFLGGANSLRGYTEKQFQGNRLLWSNLEYRLLLSRRSFAFLFFDSGYYLRGENLKMNIPENSAFKTGYGFGLNIETGLGVLSVSFALAKGDSFGEGKIHFGIINEF